MKSNQQQRKSGNLEKHKVKIEPFKKTEKLRKKK